MSRAKAPDEFTIEVDGIAVVLRKVPFRREDWSVRDDGVGHPRERELREIRVDGLLVGLAAKPHAFGKASWIVERLGAPHEAPWGDVRVHGGNRHDAVLADLGDVAGRVVVLRRQAWGRATTRLPTLEEFEAAVIAETVRKSAEKEEQRVRWAAIDAGRAAVAADAERARVEELEGLRSIEARLRGELTNMEANALLATIERLAATVDGSGRGSGGAS